MEVEKYFHVISKKPIFMQKYNNLIDVIKMWHEKIITSSGVRVGLVKEIMDMKFGHEVLFLKGIRLFTANFL